MTPKHEAPLMARSMFENSACLGQHASRYNVVGSKSCVSLQVDMALKYIFFKNVKESLGYSIESYRDDRNYY